MCGQGCSAPVQGSPVSSLTVVHALPSADTEVTCRRPCVSHGGLR
jgi:hypothetical protein